MTLQRRVYERAYPSYMTEDELLTAITDAAGYMGWRWHHVRRSDKALQMGHSGFPDLVLAKNGRVLFLELKRENAQPRPDQLAWQEALLDARVVTPSDLGALLQELAL